MTALLHGLLLSRKAALGAQSLDVPVAADELVVDHDLWEAHAPGLARELLAAFGVERELDPLVLDPELAQHGRGRVAPVAARRRVDGHAGVGVDFDAAAVHRGLLMSAQAAAPAGSTRGNSR